MNEDIYWNLLDFDLRTELIQWLTVNYPHVIPEFLETKEMKE